MKNFNFRGWLLSLLLLVVILVTNKSYAQLTGTKNIPGDYATIAAFVTDINTVGVGAGGVIINIAAGTTETAPVGGYIFTATGTIANPITIQKSGAGANPLITAYAGGTGTPGSAVQDAVFKFVGSDYITIDGIDLVDPNGANPATMEDGFVFYKASATDGCQFNTIRNCTITLNRLNNAGGSAPQFDGSIGIFFSNAIPTAAATALTVTASSGSNSFNRVYSNTIQNVNIGIGFSGFAATAGVGPNPVAASFFGDLSNDVGGTSLATGNTILNYGGAAGASNPAAGIRNSNQWSFNASFNTITNNNGSGANHVSTLRGILIGGATSANLDVLNNVITLTSGATTSQVDGISSSAGSTALSNTVNINNNTVKIAYTTATSGAVNGIVSTGTPSNIIANGNILTTNVGAALPTNNTINGTGTVLWMTLGSPVNVTANNNTISNIARTSTAGGTMRGIVITSPTNATIDGNLIENIAYSTPTSTGGFDGIYSFSSAINVTITNNIVRNISTPTTGTIRGISEFGVSGNKIISNNQVFGFSTTSGGVGGASFTGILSGTGVVTISNNQVYGLTSVGSSGGTGGTILGISLTGGTSSSISKNKIYNLSTLATGATPVINGIAVSGGGTNTIDNNIIGDLKSTSTGAGMSGLSSINGVNISGGTAANLYYNTIYLNATSTSSTTFGTSCVFLNSTSTNLDMRNNNIVNLSTPAQDGANVATNGISAGLRRVSGTAGTVPANYLNTSNNNNIWVNSAAGTNNRSAYVEGTATITNNMNTVAAMKIFMVNRDQVSISENPTFLNTATPSGTDWLHVSNVTPTLLESGASNISGLTTDFDNEIRQGNAGYSGTGSNPDIGADEFNGTTPAPVITTITVLPAGNVCVNASRGVGATITTSSPNTITSAQINYSINGVAQAAIPMTLFGLDIYTGTIPTVTPANATVIWSISATNSIGLTSTSVSQTYSDEPLTGFTGAASASLNTVCAGSPTNLTAIINNPAASTLYSTPSMSSPTTDEDIRTVKISQGATILLNNTSTVNTLTGTLGTATGTAGSYSNWTAFPATNLNAGQTYDLFVASIDPAASFFANFATAFIDYNRDGDFADAGESIIPATGAMLNAAVENGNDSITVSFTVPANALNGLTRIRVVNTETGQTNALGNVNNSFGEFEDYLINISGGLQGTTNNISSVTWMDGATTVGTGNPLTVNPTTTTTYTANITAFGCVLTPAPTTTVTVNPLPSTPTATNSAQCGAAIPTASVTSTSGLPTPTFNWYTAASGGSPVQSSTSTTFTSVVSSTTTFHVSELNTTTGCEGARVPVTITVASADPIDASASAASICIGSTVNLNVVNTNGTPVQSYTYTWQPLANSGITAPLTGASQNNIMPTVPGAYKYAVSAIDGSCSAVDSVTVVVDPFTATVTPINATCFGSNNGSFSVASTTCGTADQYSVDGGAFSSTIPTNLTAGAHTVIVQNTLGYQTSIINFTVTQPAQVPTPTSGVNSTVCQGATSATISALTAATSTVNFALSGQPLELSASSVPATVAASPNIISSFTMPALPVGATITSATLTSLPITATGNSWQSDVRIGLTGAVNQNYTQANTNNTAGTFSFNLSIPPASINAAGGLINLHYFDFFNDNGGSESTFPISPNAFTLTVNYTMPDPNITWWTATSGGANLGSGANFQTVGTSVLPNTNTPAVYTFFAEAQNGSCVSPSRFPVTVTVNANPTVNGGANVAVCQGQQATLTATGTATSYVWSPVVTNGVAFTPAATGNYIVTGTGSNGCTQNDTVLVTVNSLPIVSAGLDQTVCAGSTVTLSGSGALTYTWNNGISNGTPFTATATTTYTVTGTDGNGCQNTDQAIVNVNNATTSSVSATACVTYTWAQNGMTYTTSGAYTDTLTNAVGCDSIITLNLVINQPTSSSVSETACSSFTWAQNGMTYTTSGAYTDTITNTAGCDSIITLNLVINQPTSSSVSETACSSFTWAQNGMTYTTSGAYTDTLTNAAGCDSIITLNLVINQPTSSTVTETACGSFTWSQNGMIYTVSGAYTDTIPNAVGCDSIITLNLTINTGGTSTETATACGSYTWAQDGQTYTASGSYDHVIIGGSANGCDSTITLNLTINAFPTATATYSGDSILTASAGTTYQWIDCGTGLAIAGETSQTFQATVNGAYAVVVTNAAGCSDTSTCVTVNDLGLDGKEFTFINVYPNPTTSSVIVEMNVDNATIELVDAQGKVISVTTINNGGTIDLTNAERGVYFLRVRSENGETVKRIVKQ